MKEKKHPILAGMLVFGVLGGLFAVSLWLFAYFAGREEGLFGSEKIAVVEVKGVILDPQPIIEKIVKYRKNENIKAIILRIDSPGGAVGPAQEIHSEIKKAKKEKRVLASMGSVAASGGYYVACAADRIIANPGSITGSIGVIVESLNVEELLRKIGLETMVVKSGKHKDLGSPTRKMTEEERKLLQDVLDNVHEQFIRAVAEGRNLPVEKIRPMADGRIFSGDQALALGLVDALGGLEDTIAMAAQMAGIRGEPEVIYPEKKRASLLEWILQGAIQKMTEHFVNHSPSFYFLFSRP